MCRIFTSISGHLFLCKNLAIMHSNCPEWLVIPCEKLRINLVDSFIQTKLGNYIVVECLRLFIKWKREDSYRHFQLFYW